MIECPRGILIPLILILSVVGAYAIQNNIVDVYWMLGFGIVGYFLKIYGFQVAPIILGVILGPLIDVSYRRAMISVRDSVPNFLLDLVSNPITLALTLFIGFVLVSQTRTWTRLKARLALRRGR